MKCGSGLLNGRPSASYALGRWWWVAAPGHLVPYYYVALLYHLHSLHLGACPSKLLQWAFRPYHYIASYKRIAVTKRRSYIVRSAHPLRSIKVATTRIGSSGVLPSPTHGSWGAHRYGAPSFCSRHRSFCVGWGMRCCWMLIVRTHAHRYSPSRDRSFGDRALITVPCPLITVGVASPFGARRWTNIKR